MHKAKAFGQKEHVYLYMVPKKSACGHMFAKKLGMMCYNDYGCPNMSVVDLILMVNVTIVMYLIGFWLK